MNANIRVAAAIRRVLDRHGDVLETYPQFVHEHLLARLDVGASSEFSVLVDARARRLGDERRPIPAR